MNITNPNEIKNLALQEENYFVLFFKFQRLSGLISKVINSGEVEDEKEEKKRDRQKKEVKKTKD